MECISPTSGIVQEKENTYVGVALYYYSGAQTVLAPGKIDFFDRRKQSLLHRFVYQAQTSPNK